MDVSCFLAVILFRLSRTAAVKEPVISIDHTLSGFSCVILGAALTIITAGLGWCFYRALTAAGTTTAPQSSDEVGDEKQIAAGK